MSNSVSIQRIWRGFKRVVRKFWHWLKESSERITAIVAVIGIFLVVYQLHQSSRSAHDTAKTGTVQFSLQVMQQLDEVLQTIADDRSCYNYIWAPPTSSPPTPGSKGHAVRRFPTRCVIRRYKGSQVSARFR